jgi:hypothetical protein
MIFLFIGLKINHIMSGIIIGIKNATIGAYKYTNEKITKIVGTVNDLNEKYLIS